jgi:hypothetical protein
VDAGVGGGALQADDECRARVNGRKSARVHGVEDTEDVQLAFL